MVNKLRKYQILWIGRKIKRKITGKAGGYKKCASREVMKLQETNDMLADWILEGKSFGAGRLGSVELQAIWRSDLPENEEIQKKVLKEMRNNAGFFPESSELLKKFAGLMKTDCGQMDLLAVWYNYMEDYVVDCYAESAVLTDLMALEPWYVERPWTKALKGKKVLVIHPFAETIQKQYQKREMLFEQKDILPEFEALYVVKAVQTIAGTKDERFQNWFEALDWMYEEAMKTDFDVAIIGCGAYGFPLAARIKEAGRSAVHMGGAAQLLFGIKGRRWDHHPVIGKLYNEHWVRPSENEKPLGAQGVEEGCYW